MPFSHAPVIAPDSDGPGRKLFAGARIRRIRSSRGLTQTRMASDLGVSVSYLNLIERDQRPLSASFLLKLASSYDIDIRQLSGSDGSDLADELSRIFTDPRLTGIDVPRAELRELAARSPGIAQALVRLASTAPAAAQIAPQPGPIDAVIRMIADAGNYFHTLDTAAEMLADELRQSGPDLNAAVVDRLRARHAITVRAMPAEVLPSHLRRLDLHARQLQLSESLDAASRGFAAAVQLVLIELKSAIAAAITATGITEPLAARAATVALGKYAAAATLMPYVRFLAACEATGYDVELLQARFGRGLEQVAHRLTTLHRPGARGVPFFFLRVDRAGTISKSFAPGAPLLLSSPLPIAGGCALWHVYAAFDRPGEIGRQLVEMEDGQRFLTLARTVRTAAMPWGAARPQFAIGIGCDVAHAGPLSWSAGADLSGPATPIGPGCAACHRAQCRQRGAPPAGAPLAFDERQRGLTPFRFSED
ncbi:short-chain fatty acyl-CoA regulator family protein [Sandarakinorhabdus sp.]|uniref:helix-turn-helix domain-containing protein n=1 Tax=Sandarakinorhabdus sp. TaxID=1916663 RepID=UPI00286E6CE1|nr:short-chain fatty acyl-CoA regulator family protein [Sandarakinorhabdus sp.]